MTEKKYVITWSNREGINWYIRGIKPDGSFYGEILYMSSSPSKRCATFVEGQIPPEDWRICQDLISQLAPFSQGHEKKHFGLLGCWTTSLGVSTIIFTYDAGDEMVSDDARRFLEIKAIVEKEVAKDYPKITQPTPARDVATRAAPEE